MEPGYRAEVAAAVDAVRREEGFIVKAFFPDTNPAQLVTDHSYLFSSRHHRDDVYYGRRHDKEMY